MGWAGYNFRLTVPSSSRRKQDLAFTALPVWAAMMTLEAKHVNGRRVKTAKMASCLDVTPAIPTGHDYHTRPHQLRVGLGLFP